MSDLPDELWRKILSLGIKNSKFTYKDLCSISRSCKALYRLSGDDSLWSHLLSSDFPTPLLSFPSSSSPSPSPSPSPKLQYQNRFQRERHGENVSAALADYASFGVYLSEKVEQDSEIEAQTRAELQKENQIASEKLLVKRKRPGEKLPVKRKRQSEKLLAAALTDQVLEFERRIEVCFSKLERLFSFYSRQDSEIEARTRAELQKENQIDIISAKIQEIELAQENKKRKPTVAEYFNLPKREEEKRLHTAKKDLVSMNYHPLLDYKLEMLADNVEAEDPAAREYLVWITDFKDVFLLDDLLRNERLWLRGNAK